MSVTLDYLLEPLDCFLNDEAVEEITCQNPYQVWVFSGGKYTRHYVPQLDATWIEDLAISAGAQRRLDIWQNSPPLDTDLLGRGRINAIFAPLVAEGRPSITIRRGGSTWLTMADLKKGGLFKRARSKLIRTAHPDLVATYRHAMATEDDDERSDLLEQFFNGAAAANLTMLGAGQTASGKTSFMKAAILAIPRYEERIVAIADTPEMIGLEEFFPNAVQLFYDKNETRDGMRAADLVIAALRMRPNRLMVQEVRDGYAALALVDGLMSGHKGLTTIHANSCDEAFNRLKFVIKKTEAGAAIDDDDLLSQLRQLVDVVVHFASRDEDAEFAIDEIWFRECQE